MMDSIRENKRAAILLAGALIALVLAGVYYLYILPLQEANVAKQNANNLIRAEVTILEEQAASEEEEVVPNQDDPYELMKKVPQAIELDKIIRSMEEIELITGTRVGTINFGAYDGAGSTGFTVPEEEEVVNEEPEEQAETAETDEETPEVGDESTEAREDLEEEPEPVSTISVSQLPEELKIITMSLGVAAETEEQIVAYIKELEQLERVYRIDSLSFAFPDERQLADPEAETQISANLTISTFYYNE